MSGFDLKDGVTLSIAAVGAVLGVINTLNNLNQQKVKLKVTPKLAFTFALGFPPADLGCIEVINLSAFPVTISQMGFTLDGNKLSKNREKLLITNPRMADNGQLPRRLASREAITGYFELKYLSRRIGRAYIQTDCEEVAYGGGRVMESLRIKAGRD